MAKTLTHAFSCLLLLWSLAAQAQPSILFVDDSDDVFGNAETLQLAIDAAGYAYTVFDAAEQATSPTYEYMADFDLVIWHTSTDGDFLQLWQGNSEDNGNLQLYLEGGGQLWVIGNDFLFERYGGSEPAFEPGSFVHDFLGIASYDGQSNVEDGGGGVPYITPAPGQPIAGLDTLDWQFATLWWADFVTPRPGGIPIYQMDGPGYPLTGETTALWYDNGTSKCLSFFFDLALVSEFELAKNTTQSVLDFFFSNISSAAAQQQNLSALRLSPNPLRHATEISFHLAQAAPVSLLIHDLSGQLVAQPLHQAPLPAGPQQITWSPAAHLPAGIYRVSLLLPGSVSTQPLLYIH